MNNIAKKKPKLMTVKLIIPDSQGKVACTIKQKIPAIMFEYKREN